MAIRAQRRRVALALILTYANFAILLNSVGTVILQAMLSFGIAKTEAAILEAFKDLPIAIVSLAVAAILPRFGYRRAMIAGLCLVAAGALAMPLIPSFATTKLMFLLTGVAFALVKTSTYATIGLVTDDRRSHAALTNLIEGLFMVGVLGGYWLFAAFIDPADPSGTGWLDVYWILFAVALANMALLAASPFDERGAVDPASSGPIQDMRAMMALVARPAVFVFVFSAFLYVLIEQGVGTWLPTFNAEVLHLPTAMSVQAASLFAAALALGRLGAGGLVRVAGGLPVLLGCIAGILAVVLIVMPIAARSLPNPDMTWFNAPLATYAMPLIGLFLAPIYPTINSTILSSLPRERHAAMTGLIIVFSALGGTTGSLVTGRVFAALGGATAFQLVVVPALLLGLLLVLMHRMLGERRTAPAVRD
ncbi:MFS transporter [Sphingomonas colocasiae]|uniref:MFS transporter n=2 Tax=Sphingomonas colocasiae TaxID=1848973 RepID=A0ABS7PJN2_9SPHN|nr:MFS transporter [Sphingomonas colocasiae]